MKLKLKCAIYVKPDKNGHYPEEIARRLIAAGIAAPLNSHEVAMVDEFDEIADTHKSGKRK
jgi:hypothetical protein